MYICIAVVLRGDEAAPGAQVDARLVHAAVAIPHLVGLGACIYIYIYIERERDVDR